MKRGRPLGDAVPTLNVLACAKAERGARGQGRGGAPTSYGAPRAYFVRRAQHLGAAIVSLAWMGCGPAPAPVTPAPTSKPVAPVVTAAPTAAPDAGPKEALPSMHPCVPDFIVKELHGCETGDDPADYSAVANAMTAVTSAGPMGPAPKGQSPVQRPLAPVELKAAATARSFLCRAPAGEPDDDHSTAAFDLGRLYLNANHYEEAAVYLRDVAVLDPVKHAEVEYAARFLLEAVRALSKSRPECVATIDALTAAVEQHVCKSPGAEQRAESCDAIARGKEGKPAPVP